MQFLWNPYTKRVTRASPIHLSLLAYNGGDIKHFHYANQWTVKRILSEYLLLTLILTRRFMANNNLQFYAYKLDGVPSHTYLTLEEALSELNTEVTNVKPDICEIEFIDGIWELIRREVRCGDASDDDWVEDVDDDWVEDVLDNVISLIDAKKELLKKDQPQQKPKEDKKLTTNTSDKTA